MSERQKLIDSLRWKGINDERVLAAMSKIPREQFIPESFKPDAYLDIPLPIEGGQTISQPYIVAIMTEILLDGGDMNKVLEIGTGSGYQAAVLSHLVKDLYTVERINELYQQAQRRLQNLNLNNIHCLYANGHLGWPEHAPYEGIIVTAAAAEVPDELLNQLADGGRLIIPVDYNGGQDLKLIVRQGDQFYTKILEKVLFVPMKHGRQ